VKASRYLGRISEARVAPVALVALVLASGCQLLSGVGNLTVDPADAAPFVPDDIPEGGGGEGGDPGDAGQTTLTIATETIGGGTALASVKVNGVEACNPTPCAAGASVAVAVPVGVPALVAVEPVAKQLVHFREPAECKTTGNSCTLTPGTDGAVAKVRTLAANYAFVSSTKFTGNLGGVAGADAKCAGLAKNEGLPGTYVAWVSDGTVAAKDRPGLAAARGFVRVDGKPFADAVTGPGPDLLEGQIFLPIGLDEKGVAFDKTAFVYTGTTPSGTASASTCASWTSAAGETGTAGSALAGSVGWTSLTVETCSKNGHLYCLGKDNAVAVKPTARPAASRIAFVSAAPFVPDVNGVATADAQCAAEATAALLPGTFKALLATSTASGPSRFQLLPAKGGWYRRDDVAVVLAPNALNAPDAVPGAPLTQRADGTYATTAASVEVWTGMNQGPNKAATSTASTCLDWTSAVGTDTGTAGAASLATDRFWKNPNDGCAAARHLYCLQE